MKVRIITSGISLQKTKSSSAKELTKCILALILLCILTQTADCDRDVGVLDCDKTFRDSCQKYEVCRGFCKSSCRTEFGQVWGSGTYEQKSSICKSAIHDRRISTWDPSKRNVTFERRYFTGTFFGSIMSGVQSLDSSGDHYSRMYYRSRQSGFAFLNPRIEEGILDVFSVHQNYLFQEGKSHVQQCFGGSTASSRAFTYSKFIPGERYNSQATEKHNTMGGTVGQRMSWPGNKGKAQIGGFQCLPNDSMLSVITSLAMRADADFFPEWLTYTVSRYQFVTLFMVRHNEKNKPCDIVWKKDDDALPTSAPKPSGAMLTFDYITEGNQGIYSVSCESQPEKRGIMRLIVRVCPEKNYGDGCRHSCPKCENGGVCHDITGVCICPPGFNGTLCEKACPVGYIGQTCGVSCPKGDTNQENDQCKGLLICLPDPYGCSCGSGLKGIFCNESCSPGEFGAGCSQRRNCHCQGKQSCDKYSGICLSPCSPGWHGDACIISYPVLSSTKVYLLNSTMSTLSVSFGNWNPSTDIGEGNPVLYKILIQELNLNESAWSKESKHDGQKKENAITLDNLKPGTDYLIQVAVVDQSGNIQQNDLNKYIFSTLCDPSKETQEYCTGGVCFTPKVPLPKPTNVTIETTERDVSVTWKLPPAHLWKCRSVGIVVKYKIRKPVKEQEVYEEHYSFSTTPFTKCEVTVCLRSQIKGSNAAVSCSETVKASTKEDAPGHVENLHCSTNSPTGFSIVWEEPSEKNGVIRYYSLKYEQVGWHHQCQYPFDESIVEYNVPTTSHSVRGLMPSSNYRATVVAVTVKEGPAVSVICYTETEVPTSPPGDLISKGGGNAKYITLSWKEPFCNTTNGDIKSYSAYLEGLSAWVKKQNLMKSVEGKSVSFDVVPFTKYKAAVYVVTEAGRSRTAAELDFETEATEAPAPTDLKIYEKTSYFLSVAWRAPYPPLGEIMQYKITFAGEIKYTRPHNSYDSIRYEYGIYDWPGGKKYDKWERPRDRTVSVSESQCSIPSLKDFHCYTIRDLDANKQYKITVSAMNSGYPNGDTAEITEEAVDTAPGPPSDLKIFKDSDSSINVTWGEPYIKNGQVKKYKVTLILLRTGSSLAETSRQPIEVTKETEAKEWAFKNLFPATTYQVQVRARNKVGYGLPAYQSRHTPTKVPVINKGLKFVGATETTITVTVFRQDQFGGPIMAYFVVVKELPEEKRSKRSIPNFLIPAPGCALKMIEKQYVAGKLLYLPPAGKNFTIGNGICTEGYNNKKLTIDMSYKVGLIIMAEYESDRKYSQIRYIPDPIRPIKYSDDAATYGILIGVLMLLTILVCLLIFFYVGRGDKALTDLEKQALARAKRRAREGVPPIPGAIPSDLAYSNSLYGEEFLEAESVMEEISYIVAVKELESYTLKSIKNNELKRQFAAIPKEQAFRSHSGRLSVNRQKNRYGNMMPYDHTRVVLPILHNDLHSDYINANYVTGYKKLKTYIATQGPLPKTINDFWRMVWNEKVCKIVMVTNLVEGGRVKCEQYWPDSEGNYGRLTVSLMISESYSDYIIRTFDVDSGRSSRQVKQFHFVTWPDHSAPEYTTTVVNFMEEVRNYRPDDKSPIIVHCSAGVGRTGTIILLDSMLDMAKNAEEVDVCGHLCQMRRQRNNVVENMEQYLFVYKALVQALCWGKTSYASSEIVANLSKLRTSASRKTPSALEKQYQCLSKICPDVDNAAARSGNQPENVARNRVMKILPLERGRPILRPRPNGGSTYINAVYVDGYKQKDKFVATQYPLPCTITDFWELIWEIKSKTIVLLQEISFKNSKSPQYWPAEGETVFYDELKIQCTSMEVQGDVRVWSFTLSNLNAEGEPALHLKLLHHLNWAVDAPFPHNPESLLNLVDMVEKLQEENEIKNTITVQCLNGSTACGIFCATEFLCAKMKDEQEVDVFLAVQTIRTNRPHFIESFAQYNFLYDVAVKFLDSFGGYANFF